MVSWHWLVLGLVLAAAEMVTPGGFYFIFMGLGAIVVGAALGLGVPMPTWVQILIFCVLSCALLVLFRGRLQRRLMKKSAASFQHPDTMDIVGEIATVMEDIAVDAVGKVELRGTVWNARGEGPLGKGQRCRVTKVDGLTLSVRPE